MWGPEYRVEDREEARADARGARQAVLVRRQVLQPAQLLVGIFGLGVGIRTYTLMARLLPKPYTLHPTPYTLHTEGGQRPARPRA